MSQTEDARIDALEQMVTPDDLTFLLTRTNKSLGYCTDCPSAGVGDRDGCAKPDVGDEESASGRQFQIATRCSDLYSPFRAG